MDTYRKIDFHMHTVVSDGTDTPAELLARVKEVGLTHFSITDHDDIEGCMQMRSLLREGDPLFIPGVEFSCKDDKGRYHILGYGYDPQSTSIQTLIKEGHESRLYKLKKRLDFLEEEFGIIFSPQDKEKLFSSKNPGKPHIGNMMATYGYAPSRDEAIIQFINKCKSDEKPLAPQTAIQAILDAGGAPVLAHPPFGSGRSRIVGDEMDERLRRLVGFGLRGVECFYSGYTPELQNEMLAFAQKYDLYVTAGSDYHGNNKSVRLGETHFDESVPYPEGLIRFLRDVAKA